MPSSKKQRITGTAIRVELRRLKPHASESTIDAYQSSLQNLAKECDLKSMSDFNLYNRMIACVERNHVNPQTKNVFFSALYAIDPLEIYKQKIEENNKQIHAKYDEQTPAKNQKSFAETMARYEEVKSRMDWSREDSVFDVILMMLFCGVVPGLPPRRLVDYTTMTFSATNKNYLDVAKKQFVFNEYKTAKKYGEQRVDIPQEVFDTIMRWHKLYENPYVLGKHYSKSSMSQMLTRRFGMSVDALRSSYLSDYYKNLPELKNMEQTAADMGHSVETAITRYVKK